MTNPILSIIVVSYNTCDMTVECLRSVVSETHTPFELIVVDNASTDGSPAAISKEFPKATLLAETVNHGFAKANNIASEVARGKYLLLLNPDTVVLNGALDTLVAFAQERPEAKIWGGKTLFGDGRLNPASCWRQMTLWGLFSSAFGLSKIFKNSAIFNPEAYGGWDRNSERDVDIVTGCLFLILKEDWEALGGFDTTFFMYGEEADLCLRARAIGARPRVTPEAIIVHHAGASETVRADKMVRLLKAKRELIKRHFPAWQQPFAGVLFAGWPLSRYLILSIVSPVLGSLQLHSGAITWREVWKRKDEWDKGFG